MSKNGDRTQVSGAAPARPLEANEITGLERLTNSVLARTALKRGRK